MKSVFILSLLSLTACAFARPQGYSIPAPSQSFGPQSSTGFGSSASAGFESSAVPTCSQAPKSAPADIVKDDREHGEDGSYSFGIETGNGIVRSESGKPGAEGGVSQQGSVSFTFPSGEQFTLTFVADEEGYKPESPFLPVPPEFPHPIPDFVLEQIEKAKREDAAQAANGGAGGGQVGRPIVEPSQTYNRPYNK